MASFGDFDSGKNDHTSDRRLDCLQTLQLLLSGIWQIAHLHRRNLAYTMVLDRTLRTGSFPGLLFLPFYQLIVTTNQVVFLARSSCIEKAGFKCCIKDAHGDQL